MTSTPLDALLTIAIVVAAPLAFVGFWVAICLLLATLGGWQRLAKRYRAVGAGPPTVGCYGTLGNVSYKSTLQVGAGPGGLELGVMALFRAGHPPLRIPWSDVRVEGERTMLFGTKLTQLRVGQDGTRLQVPSEVWKRLTQPR